MFVAKKPLIIYVSGPYSDPIDAGRLANTTEAMRIGLELHKRGHIPLIPHLTHWLDEYAKKCQVEVTYSDYLTWDLSLLQKCDALYLIKPSMGAMIEHGMARTWGLDVFYSLDEVPKGNLKLPK